MRQVNLADPLEPIAVTDAVGCCRPFPTAVERHDRRVVERRGVKRARGVRNMVIHEVPPIGPTHTGAAESCLQMVRHSAHQMAGRIHDRGEEERIPSSVPFLGYWVRTRLQRQRYLRCTYVPA